MNDKDQNNKQTHIQKLNKRNWGGIDYAVEIYDIKKRSMKQ